MLYATLTFWLLVIVFTAWGVHELLTGLFKARVVNSLLLPGTLVAQIGHVLGLLVTGGTINNTTLYKDDDTGAPETTPDAKPRVPIIGPVIVGMLPLLACAAGIFVASRYLGGAFLRSGGVPVVARTLPTSLNMFWEMLREQITLAQMLCGAVVDAGAGGWRSWLFIYVLACLTIRMAPFPGTLRGTLGAIVLLGLGAALLGALVPATQSFIEHGWGVLGLAVAALTFLLLASLTIRGIVGLLKLLGANR